jgi:hypothetical protein
MELRRLADRNKRITLDTFYEFSAIVDGSGCLKEAVFAIILNLFWRGKYGFYWRSYVQNCTDNKS